MTQSCKTVATVVQNRLCTGCGTCVAACPPGAIAMAESAAGFPRPSIDEGKCTHCELCHRVCSGVHDPHRVGKDIDGLFFPPLLKTCLARASDPRIHAVAQTGGVLTGLLTHLMRTGRITHALVTRMPTDGSLRPQAFFASSPEQLLETVGSKYCLNPLNAALAKWPGGDARVAYVGLPCHVHGLRNLQRLLPNRWGGRFELVMGLFCRQASGYMCFDHLMRFRSKQGPVAKVYFRKKDQPWERGRPCIEYADGSCQYFDVDFIWEFFNSAFVPLRCWFCFDQLNGLSDLAVGDPNGLGEDIATKGLNAAAIYTQRGLDAINEAREAGAIETVPCDCKDLWRGQAIVPTRRKRVLTAYRLSAALGRPFPEMPILTDGARIKVSLMTKANYRFHWEIESTASRSEAYAKAARWKLLLHTIGRAKGLFTRCLGHRRSTQGDA